VIPAKPISHCRLSPSTHLISVLNLGEQELTGVFPKTATDPVSSGPLELVWCPESGLLQLRHSFDASEMYGDNYGYRSGLNQSMIDHLGAKAASLEEVAGLTADDVVLDIGSNDGTLLKSFQVAGISKFGIDPTGEKFREFFPKDAVLNPTFFTAESYRAVAGTRKAKIVTSIAMFYDLDRPDDFVADVAAILAKDGIWHFEQSYMPTMLRMNSYDTVCHEHLEYYSLRPIKSLLERHGLKITSVRMNAINGGSFAITAAHASSAYSPETEVIQWLLAQEDRLGLDTPRPFRRFEERVFEHRQNLRSLIVALRNSGKTVLGYGASTKGNVLLQFCGITPDLVPAIAEVNADKFGRYTPGTRIPIISEQEARAARPDYLLVLPWHFRDGIIRREREYLAKGGRLIFPLPEIEIV